MSVISALRAYALQHARALRVLRSVKSQGQAAAYQDMADRLAILEKDNEAREPLVQEVIAAYAEYDKTLNAVRLFNAVRALVGWKP